MSKDTCVSRKSFIVAGAAASLAAIGAGSALAEEAAPAAEEAAPEAEAETAETAATATAGMTFTGNSGKTMGEVLGAGWLGEEPQIDASQIAETVQTQIVICGAGNAGTAVARRAAELGASVIVVDSQPEDGFGVYGNDIGHLNSSWQLDTIGVPEYDPIQFMNEYQIYCANRAQAGLVQQFAYRSGEAFDWFIEPLTDDEKTGIVALNWPPIEGYKYEKQPFFMSYVGTANFDGGTIGLQDAVLRNQEEAKNAGAEFRYETTAVRLVHSDDNTEVTGVICQDADGSYIEIDADAVVLACGDIGQNTAMYDAICGELYGLYEYQDLVAMSARDGSGIAMAMRMGAKVEIATGGDMGSHASFPLSQLEGCQTIWLNKYGKRFCNETYGGSLLSGVASMRQPGSILYSIWDANWKELLLNQPAGHMILKYWDDETIDEISGYMEAAIGSGADGDETSGKVLYCADTLEELFTYMGMSEGAAANALAEVEAWNAACEAGRDDEFGRNPDMLIPIAEPPYYGYVGAKGGMGGSLVTTSGLLVTENQQVQGQGFEPIRGLFACGNTSGGRFPMGYNGIMNGVSIGMCLTLGYTLGEYLAAGDIDVSTVA